MSEERYTPIEEIRKQAEVDRANSKEFRNKEAKKRKNRAALLLATALTTIGIGGYKAATQGASEKGAGASVAEPGEVSPEQEQQEAVDGITQQNIQEDAQKEYEKLVEEEAEKQKAEIRESLKKE